VDVVFGLSSPSEIDFFILHISIRGQGKAIVVGTASPGDSGIIAGQVSRLGLECMFGNSGGGK